MILYSAEAERRDRLLIAAVWLITLGSVFLVKEVTGWGWTEAWPLFVILVGIGTGGAALISRRHTGIGMWGLWWPLTLIAVGVVLLLSTTGQINVGLNELIGWWPLAVIAIGVWFLIGAVIFREPNVRTESVSLPLAGVQQAEIKLKFGGGELVVGPAEPGILLAGSFEGGVVQRSKGAGQVELEPHTGAWPFFWDRPLRWNVLLTTEIPVDLALESGANRSTIDLSPLSIRRLELKTGASETRIRLPAQGSTSVRAEAGVAAVTLEVPQGVSARIRSKVALGSTSIDESRFPRSLEGWASPDFETATNRVDIELQGGLGSIRVL